MSTKLAPRMTASLAASGASQLHRSWFNWSYLSLWLLVWSLLWGGPIASAQGAPSGPANIQIMKVDSTQLPYVNVSVFSTDLPLDMLRLPIEIIEISDHHKKTVTDFRTYPDYLGASRLLIINGECFDNIGANGRTHHANFESIVRKVYDHSTIFTNEDWMSSYTVARSLGATQITEWTQDKSSYFIDLVTHKVSGEDDQTLTVPGVSGLHSVFKRFELLTQDEQTVKSVIVFSDSTQSILSAGRASLANLISYAQQNQIYVHGVHMGRLDVQDQSLPDMDLKVLIEETSGVYVYYQAESDLIPLWLRLNEEKQRTRLVYKPDNQNLQAIQVQIRLPDGSYARSDVQPISLPTPNLLSAKNEDLSSQANQSLSVKLPKRIPGVSEDVVPSDDQSEVDTSLTWSQNFFGLVAGLSSALSTISRGTILILWALCLGVLFFLIFPEISNGWKWLQCLKKTLRKQLLQFLSRAKHPVDAQSRHRASQRIPHPLGKLRGRYSMNGQAKHVSGNGLSKSSPYQKVRFKDEKFEDESDVTDIQRPIPKQEIGKLMRITYDSALPPEVAIYQMSQSDANEICMYIGRDQQRSTIIIPDHKRRISRDHATLIFEKGLPYLRDNSSEAGTYLNGIKLKNNERKLLRDGDRIGLGQVEYQLQLQSEEPTIANISDKVE